MSQNYIVINGKKAELTLEQLKVLGIEPEKKNPFDYGKIDENYYRITSYGAVVKDDLGLSQENHLRCARLKEVANYCTDKALLQQQAYRETLNRLLWRFSMENNRGNEKWCLDDRKYQIIYNHNGNEWIIDWSSFYQRIGVVYFDSEETAQRAIEEIVVPFMKSHPDFKL